LNSSRIVRKKVSREGLTIYLNYLEFENGCIVILSEGKERLGTVAVAIPASVGLPISQAVLGDKWAMSSRLIAEHLAKKTGKICIVSINMGAMRAGEFERTLISLIEDALAEGEET